MRIAVVCPYDMGEVGGVQSHVVDLVDRLRLAGEDAFLVAPGAPRDLGVDVGSTVSVPGNESRSPVALAPGAAVRTVRALRVADVVHVHEPMMPVVGPAALTAGRPTVATFHAAVAPWTKRLYRSFSWVGRGLLGGARLTAVSDTAAAGLPASWSPISIIPNGLDVRSFEVDVGRVPARVAFLGRDEPRKGLDVLLAAWPGVRAVKPDAELAVIGSSRSASIPGVTWHGRVEESTKRALLASSAVFVAPNLGGESFGIVLTEAMAAGCAVVASALPAFVSVLEGAGLFVPPGNSDALTETIARLLDAPEEVDRLATAASERVRRFDWANVVDRYRSLYAEASNIAT